MNEAKERVCAAIERLVCEVINESFERERPKMSGEATPSNIYVNPGRGSVLLRISTARRMSFFVMKDMFGLTYKDIAERSGFSAVSIMRNIRKARYGGRYDAFMERAKKAVMEKVQEEIIL